MKKIKLEINLPVLNEEKILRSSVEKLHSFLALKMSNYDYNIMIIDNGSIDNTKSICEQLSQQYFNVNFLCLEKKGRGRALRTAWNKSDADICCYMDIDLSTDLEALPRLIDPMVEGDNDIVIGSRLMKDSSVIRSIKREIISRVYLFFVKIFLGNLFSDLQCGFKAVNKKLIKEVLPHVIDQEWFFDTELVFKAAKWGYKVKEIPVRWQEDLDSRVKIYKTSKNFLKSLLRLRLEFSIDRVRP